MKSREYLCSSGIRGIQCRSGRTLSTSRIAASLGSAKNSGRGLVGIGLGRSLIPPENIRMISACNLSLCSAEIFDKMEARMVSFILPLTFIAVSG